MTAPMCSELSRSCTAPKSLLNGTAANNEPNQLGRRASNTIDNCQDGSAGTYGVDESIEWLSIVSVEPDGQLSDLPLRIGGRAKIITGVHAWTSDGDPSNDRADFYYSNSTGADPPNWSFLETRQVAFGDVDSNGFGTFESEPFTIGGSESMQAIRVNFRYLGQASQCTGGNWADTDDVAFYVASNVPSTAPPSPSARPVTSSPTARPTEKATTPTPSPNLSQTAQPTANPSVSPSAKPTTRSPSSSPVTSNPSSSPSAKPTTLSPTSQSPSAYPTSRPTTSAPSGGENTSLRTQVCGVPGKCNSIGGDEITASKTALGAVRCCRDASHGPAGGWPKKCTSISNVWGESNMENIPDGITASNGGCVETNFAGAIETCQANNARLCTPEEMLDRCTRGTGCSFNKFHVWVAIASGNACSTNSECASGSCNGGTCS